LLLLLLAPTCVNTAVSLDLAAVGCSSLSYQQQWAPHAKQSKALGMFVMADSAVKAE
jgi:hypothetical protein